MELLQVGMWWNLHLSTFTWNMGEKIRSAILRVEVCSDSSERSENVLIKISCEWNRKPHGAQVYIYFTTVLTSIVFKNKNYGGLMIGNNNFKCCFDNLTCWWTLNKAFRILWHENLNKLTSFISIFKNS